MTDFPNQGDDLKISLRNSERPQFDFSFAQASRTVSQTSGRQEATSVAMKPSPCGAEPEMVKRQRECWIGSRERSLGSQACRRWLTVSSSFTNPEQHCWGGGSHEVGCDPDIGESTMKDAVMELVKKREGKQEDRAWDDGLSSSVATGIENRVEEYK